MDTNRGRETSEERVRVGLNGFGRIGRSVFRAVSDHPRVDLVAVNDVMDPDDMRYLAAYDSVAGRLDGVELVDGSLRYGDVSARVFGEEDPAALPWDALDVDVALECTGVFRTREGASAHLDAGADTVVISAPPKGDDPVPQIVYGVNHESYDGADVVSNASCTTNSVAPVASVLDDRFGIETGLLTTIHSYTSSQRLVDSPATKRRRGRAAAENIVPTTTGAATATTEVLPQLRGRLDGMAVRVPTPNGSLTALTVTLDSEVDRVAVNDAFREAATGDFAGVIGVTDESVVSRDIVGEPYSSLVDLQSTTVVDATHARVLAWYDNEFGFANRMLDVARHVATS